nr:unnamed protein product [Spirometra erinaceieuropaei]
MRLRRQPHKKPQDKRPSDKSDIVLLNVFDDLLDLNNQVVPHLEELLAPKDNTSMRARWYPLQSVTHSDAMEVLGCAHRQSQGWFDDDDDDDNEKYAIWSPRRTGCTESVPNVRPAQTRHHRQRILTTNPFHLVHDADGHSEHGSAPSDTIGPNAIPTRHRLHLVPNTANTMMPTAAAAAAAAAATTTTTTNDEQTPNFNRSPPSLPSIPQALRQ